MLVSNKNKWLLKVVLVFLILLSILSVKSLAVVSPTSDFYFNDYANLLNEETKKYIISVNKNLYNKTGAQIVVVTIPKLGNNSIEDYATELFRNFGIGDKNKNNGVLLLLSLEERQFRIEVGYGLEGILPDAKTGRIQDNYIIPYLKQNNWNKGIINGFNAILEEISNEYNIETGDLGVDKQVANVVLSPKGKFAFVVIPVISTIVGIVLKILEKFKCISKKNKKLLSFIYLIIAIGITAQIVKEIAVICLLSIMNIIAFFFIGNGSLSVSFGGSSSGRGSSRWRRIFRRIFWRGRFFTVEEGVQEVFKNIIDIYVKFCYNK